MEEGAYDQVLPAMDPVDDQSGLNEPVDGNEMEDLVLQMLEKMVK